MIGKYIAYNTGIKSIRATNRDYNYLENCINLRQVTNRYIITII